MIEENIAQLIKVLEVVLFVMMGINVLVFILAGFKFIFAEGDPMMTEQAKEQLVLASTGMILLVVVSQVLKVIGTSGVSPISNEVGKIIPGIILVFIVVGAAIVPFLLYKLLRDSENKEKYKEIVVNETNEKLPNTTINLLTKIEEAVQNNQLPIALSEHFTYILSKTKKFQEVLPILDIEDKYIIEESMEIDVLALYQSYMEVPDMKKQDMEADMVQGLLQLRHQLDDIQEKIDQQRINSLHKKLVVIEKKYTK